MQPTSVLKAQILADRLQLLRSVLAGVVIVTFFVGITAYEWQHSVRSDVTNQLKVGSGFRADLDWLRRNHYRIESSEAVSKSAVVSGSELSPVAQTVLKERTSYRWRDLGAVIQVIVVRQNSYSCGVQNQFYFFYFDRDDRLINSQTSLQTVC